MKGKKSWNGYAGEGWWWFLVPPFCLYGLLLVYPIALYEFIKYKITGEEHPEEHRWEI